MLQLWKAVVKVFCERRILAEMPLPVEFSMRNTFCECIVLHLAVSKGRKHTCMPLNKLRSVSFLNMPLQTADVPSELILSIEPCFCFSLYIFSCCSTCESVGSSSLSNRP